MLGELANYLAAASPRALLSTTDQGASLRS
jgi:hypothetical protein